MVDPARRRDERRNDDAKLLPTMRLEAFSDGVFAIAITLLVLELHPPEVEERLLPALASQWPEYLSYIVSFTFIGSVWIAHSNMTRFMEAVTPALMRLNLILLLFVSLLPFTTSLLSAQLEDSDEGIALMLFGLNLTLAALLMSLLIAFVARSPLLVADHVAGEELQAFARERRLALLLLAAATGAGLFLPLAALLVFLGISVLLIGEPLWRARRQPPPRIRQ